MTINKAVRYVLYLAIFLIPFIPLYVASQAGHELFFPFITGKNFAFRILIEIAFAAWLFLLVRKDVGPTRPSRIFIALTTFIVVVFLACLFGENFYRSFWSNFERMEGFVTLIHMFAYFWVIIATFTREELWNRFFYTSMLGAGIVSVIGLMQTYGELAISQSTTRIDATFGNAIYLAVYMMFHIFIALYFLVKPNIANWQKSIFGAAAILYAVVLYHTATRGATLGLVAGLGLALLLTIFSSSGKLKKYSLIALSAIVVLAGLFFAIRKTEFVQTNQVLSRFAHISFNDSTTQSRLIIWGMALKGVKAHPILGYGLENFNIVFNKYFDPRLHRQETWFDRTHNAAIDWLVMTGVLGLLAYLAIFLAMVWVLWKYVSPSVSPLQRNLLIGAFAAYFFQNLFVFDNLTSYMMFFALLAYCHFITSIREPEFGLISKMQGWGIMIRNYLSGPAQIYLAPIIPILLIGVIYFVNVKPIEANRLMLVSLYSPRALSEPKLAMLQKVMNLNTFGSMEAREQTLLLLTEVGRQPGIDQNLLLNYLEFARTQMLKQLESTGNDARHQLFMGSFMHSFAGAKEALPFYEKALELSPKKQLTLFSLSRAYQDLGDYDKALSYAEEAYNLAPDYGRSQIEYAAALMYKKRFVDADTILMKHYNTLLVVDPRIIQAYAQNGKLDRVIAIWQDQVKNHPDDANAYMSLAASYYANFQDSKAIAILQELEKKNPASKAQIDSFIAQIRAGTLPRM